MNNEQPNPNNEQLFSGADLATNRKSSSAGGEINLLKLLLVLAKHWKIIVGVPILVAVITAIISLFMVNIYTAKTMIFPVDDDNSGVMGMMAQMGGLAGIAGAGFGNGGSKADLYVTMLKSETIKDSVIDRFKLMKLYEVKLRADAYAKLDDNSNISVSKKDGVLTIAVDNADPKLAAAIANTYVEELGKLAAKIKMSGAGKNREFLEERLIKSKADLATSEDRLKVFQTRNKAVAVTDQARATLEGVAQLHAQLISQEVQLANLQRQFTTESQEVKSTKATINNLRGQIARLEGSGVQGSMPGIGAMPQLGLEYMRLMRDFTIQATLVELLTKQYEMSKLSELKDLAPFQILQQANVPELKSGPRRSIMVIIAFLGSSFLMVLVAIMRDFIERMNEEDRKRWQELKRLFPLPHRLRKHFACMSVDSNTEK